MFEGDIICQSVHGQGSNFVFIVCLESDSSQSMDSGNTVKRLLNPVQHKYNKLVIQNKQTSNIIDVQD